jgi:hypothetical protein
MHPKWLKFISLTTWLVLTRAIDVYATFQYTPDLTMEANPLVSVFGLNSWSVLISIIVTLLVFVIYLYYIHIFKRDLPYPEEKGYSFSEFAGYLYFGKKRPWYEMMYRIPFDLKQNLQVMGVILPYGLAFAGLVSTLMWYGIYFLPELYTPFHNVWAIWIIIGVGCIASCIWFVKGEYKIYQQKKST